MVKYADMEISIHSGKSHSYLAEAMFAATDEKTQELARAMGEDWKVLIYIQMLLPKVQWLLCRKWEDPH